VDVNHLKGLDGLGVSTDRMSSSLVRGELSDETTSQERYMAWRFGKDFPAEYLLPHITRDIKREAPRFMDDPKGNLELPLSALRDRVREHNPWFLPFRMRDDFYTMDMTSPLANDAADRVQFRSELIVGTVERLLGDDIGDTTVLDIGCNDGFFSLDMAYRGAKHVDGIDLRPKNIAKARFLAEHYGIDNVQFDASDADAFEPGRQWDVVLNLGVLYHVVNPLQFIRQTYRLCRRFAIIDTIVHHEPISGYVLFGDKNIYKPAEGREAWEFHPTYRGAIDTIRYAGFSEVIEILGDADPPHDYYAAGGRRCFLAIK
jgi:SAM-dependent methyltransferase